jgi:hypothetical protein
MIIVALGRGGTRNVVWERAKLKKKKKKKKKNWGQEINF